MYQDEDDERVLRGSPGDDRVDYKSPIDSGSGSGSRPPRPPARPQARLRSGSPRGAAEHWTPAMTPRRGPSHPDWERPLTQYDYPELRGREDHRAIWPLAAAAMGVTLVVVLLVIIPTLLGGRGGGVSVATGTPTATASGSIGPNASASSNPSAIVTTGAPTPSIFYATHYTVLKGDRFANIAKKYKLQAWELQQANPQVTNPALLKVGMVLNIPLPGQLTKAAPTPVPTPTPAPTPTPTPTPAG